MRMLFVFVTDQGPGMSEDHLLDPVDELAVQVAPRNPLTGIRPVGEGSCVSSGVAVFSMPQRQPV